MKRNVLGLKVICLTLILATLASFIACDNGGVGESEKGSTPKINENDSPDENIDDDKNGEDDNRNAVKIYYNDDGSIDYEEYYDDNGLLNKEVDYFLGYKNIWEYDKNGNKIKCTLSRQEDGTIFGYTVFVYDNHHNMIEEIGYDKDNTIIKHFDFEYNEYGALIKETRISEGIVQIYEYDLGNSQEKHKHLFHIMLDEGVFTAQYEMDIDESGTLRLNYGRIVSYIYYRADGSVRRKYIREYNANNDYVIRDITYAEDGSVEFEQLLDKKGNVIERLYP